MGYSINKFKIDLAIDTLISRVTIDIVAIAMEIIYSTITPIVISLISFLVALIIIYFSHTLAIG